MHLQPLVSLKRLSLTDAAALAKLANNKRIWDNVRDILPHPYSKADAIEFIQRTASEQPPVTFGIFDTDEFCGIVGLVLQPDIYRKSAEIGYWIGEPRWNRGLASAAVKLITRYGFEKLELERIYAGIFAHNIASMKVLEKNGYQFEGIARNALIKNGRLSDEHRYAILRP